jgi:hypothetical protein
MHPTCSSVLYLTSGGGPTLVLEQTPGMGEQQQGEQQQGEQQQGEQQQGQQEQGEQGGQAAEDGGGAQPLAERGWLVQPAANRLLLFPGNLLHGVLPGSGGGSSAVGAGAGGGPGAGSGGSVGSPFGSQQQERTTVIIAWWGAELQASLEGRQGGQQQQQPGQPGPCMCQPFRGAAQQAAPAAAAQGSVPGSGPGSGGAAAAEPDATGVLAGETATATDAQVAPGAAAAAAATAAVAAAAAQRGPSPWEQSLQPVALDGGAASRAAQEWRYGTARSSCSSVGAAEPGGAGSIGSITEVAPAWQRVRQQGIQQEVHPVQGWLEAGEVVREAAQLVGRPVHQLMPRLQFFLSNSSEVRDMYVRGGHPGG